MWVLCKTKAWGKCCLRGIMSNELLSKASSPKPVFSKSLHGLCSIQRVEKPLGVICSRAARADQEIPRHTDPCCHCLPLPRAFFPGLYGALFLSLAPAKKGRHHRSPPLLGAMASHTLKPTRLPPSTPILVHLLVPSTQGHCQVALLGMLPSPSCHTYSPPSPITHANPTTTTTTPHLTTFTDFPLTLSLHQPVCHPSHFNCTLAIHLPASPMTQPRPPLYGEPVLWSLCVPNQTQTFPPTGPTQLLLSPLSFGGAPSPPTSCLPLPPTPPGSLLPLAQVDVLTAHFFTIPNPNPSVRTGFLSFFCQEAFPG